MTHHDVQDAAVDAYELVDAGDGARLERFGPYLVDRPAPGALAPRRAPDAWEHADLRFDRDRGWSGRRRAIRDGWAIEVAGLDVRLRPTPTGQLGLYPEHLATVDWLTEQVEARTGKASPPTVLHLFAYTGLVTLALLRAGASVAHVDASRPAVTWARANAAANQLAGAPVRWLVEDVPTFVARERRRGRRYDGVVLDPPTYGHGGTGLTWRLERDLPPLLAELRGVLAPDGFLLLTAHTPDVGRGQLRDLVRRFGGRVNAGDLAIDATSGAHLALGAFVRVDAAS